MAKHFSKKYRNMGWVFNYLQSESYAKMPWCYIPTSLPPEPSSILSWIQALDTKRPIASPSPFYPASVVLFQLHGGMVSHMQVLPTPSSTVHNTKYLDPYHWKHISFRCLLLRQWCRDVASSTDRYLDITFRLQVVESLSLVPILFRKAFSHPYISFFSFTSKWFFCY